MCDPVTIIEGVKTVATVASAYSGVKQAETSERAQREQAKLLKEKQAAEKKEIERQNKIAADKRKATSDRLRKQLVGADDYSVGQTGATGVDAAIAGETLTGQELG